MFSVSKEMTLTLIQYNSEWNTMIRKEKKDQLTLLKEDLL